MQAFGHAVALQLFALRQAGSASALASAAVAAGDGLTAAEAALAAYVRQFLGVAGTAAAAAESHALLQRCQATLGTAAAQEQQLEAQAEEGHVALAAVLAEAQPVASQVLAALQECQVRCMAAVHAAVLPPVQRKSSLMHCNLCIASLHSPCRHGSSGTMRCCPCC